MGRKCTVYGCNSGYLTCKEKVTVYKFPTDPIENKKWVDALPNKDIKNTKNLGVCSKHFKEDCPMRKVVFFSISLFSPIISSLKVLSLFVVQG